MPDERFELSRRNALLGLSTVSVASAGAGIGTSAYFSDEESAEDNTLTAGELDLYVDYVTAVERVEAGDTTGTGTIRGTEFAAVTHAIGDIYPGDRGTLMFCPKVVDTPSWIWIRSDGVVDDKNGWTESEADVDETGGNPREGEGELSENVRVAVSYCELVEGGDPTDPDDYATIRELEAPDGYTLAELAAELRTGFLIDGDTRTEGTQAYPGSEDDDAQEGPCLRIDWEVPLAVGNEIRADSVEFDIEFHAQQERHSSERTTSFGATVSDDTEATTTLSDVEPVAFPDDYRDDIPYASPTTVVGRSGAPQSNDSLIGVPGFDSSAGRAPRRPEVAGPGRLGGGLPPTAGNLLLQTNERQQ